MKYLLNGLVFTLCFCFSYQGAMAWGFWAHQRINRMAVFTLPPELLGVYKANIEYLTEHAVDPDMRRYAVDGEAGRHYIDVDHYGVYPFENVPRYWKAAVEVFGEETLDAYGIVPYHIPREIKRLEEAFKRKDLNMIMKVSADLGHYVGDSHVPLHTTENYNGQMTGQKGIHGFWESRLPELFAEEFNLYVGRAYYVKDIYLEPWDAVLESHNALDSVLRFEKELTESYPNDKKFGYESRNSLVVRTYSREFSEAYHKMLDGMVERRMRKAILRIGSFWYTAWKNAGSPDLRDLTKEELQINKEKYQKRLKIVDRESDDIGGLWDLLDSVDDVRFLSLNLQPKVNIGLQLIQRGLPVEDPLYIDQHHSAAILPNRREEDA